MEYLRVYVLVGMGVVAYSFSLMDRASGVKLRKMRSDSGAAVFWLMMSLAVAVCSVIYPLFVLAIKRR